MKDAWNEYIDGIDSSFNDRAYYYSGSMAIDPLKESQVELLYKRYRENTSPEIFEGMYGIDIHPVELEMYKTRCRENLIGRSERPVRTHFRENLAELNALLVADDGLPTQKSLSEVVEAKYAKLYDTAYRIAAGRSIKRHAFICGAAGVGKTYTVSKGVDAGAKESGREVVNLAGDIGSSMTNIVSFLFLNRDDKIVVLDDCDGFFTSAKQDIMNTLKAALDPTRKKIDIAKTIQNKINREVLPNVTREGFIMDVSRLRENVVSFYSDGNLLHEEKISDRDKRHFLEAMSDEDAEEAIRRDLNLGSYKPKNKISDAKNTLVSEKKSGDKFNVADDDDDGYDEIPDKFAFRSSIIFISNLAVSKIDKAIISRCNVVEFTLTNEEFMERVKQVFPSLLSDVTSIQKDALEWAKENSYRFLSACIEAEKTGKKIAGRKVDINIPMEFRLFSDFVDDWISDAQDYINKHGEAPYDIIEKKIAGTYVLESMLPRLAGRI
jgi:Mor family transcriptional regulator